MSDEQSFDINALLGKAMEMRQKIQAAQQDAARQVFTGSAASGAVQVDLTGGGEFVAVRLQESVVDPTDISMLEDLVLAALRDGAAKVAAANAAAMGNIGLPAGLAGLGGGLG